MDLILIKNFLSLYIYLIYEREKISNRRKIELYKNIVITYIYIYKASRNKNLVSGFSIISNTVLSLRFNEKKKHRIKQENGLKCQLNYFLFY